MNNTFNIHELHQNFCRAYAAVKDDMPMEQTKYGVFAPLVLDAQGTLILDCYELEPTTPWGWGLSINEVLDQLLPIVPKGIYLSLVREPYLIGVYLDANLANAVGFRTPITDLEAPPAQYVDVYDALPSLASIGGRQPFRKH